jgi:hypothetical protein
MLSFLRWALWQTGKVVVNRYVRLEPGGQSRDVVRIGDIAGRAWHPGAAAPASVFAVPWLIVMRRGRVDQKRFPSSQAIAEPIACAVVRDGGHSG